LSGGDPFRLLETGEGHRFRVEIPAASPLFAGHFPGHPILPGVAHLAIVERALGVPIIAGRSLRLRRPVTPGEALDLSLGPPGDDGWTRFDISREGAPVSGGGVRTSPAADGAEPEEATLPAVEEFPILLPHTPPARLIRGVLAVTEAGIVCVAAIPPDHPLAVAGRLLGVEAAAQAAAVLEAIGRRGDRGEEGPEPRIGYLVGVREARFAASLAAGRPFRVSARLQGSAPPLSVYEIAVGEPGHEVATGTISTFLAGPARDGPYS
jgi:3-hydroxymyristoyl/3-hydroxydecanoyl-(acyl carrier protein) dehydratase